MKWFRDVVLVPVVIAFVFVFYGAWYSGVKWHAPFGATWFRAIFSTPVPLWVLLCVLTVGAIFAGLYRRAVITLKGERTKTETLEHDSEVNNARHLSELAAAVERHQAELNALRRPEARLEAVWEESIWGDDSVDGQPAIYLSGWAYFSIHYGASACVLVQASVNGSEVVSIPPIHLGGRLDRHQFFTNVAPPIGTHGEPLQATITFIDTRNRHYVLPERTFQWSSSPGDS